MMIIRMTFWGVKSVKLPLRFVDTRSPTVVARSARRSMLVVLGDELIEAIVCWI
jgi:hypothetical protein